MTTEETLIQIPSKYRAPIYHSFFVYKNYLVSNFLCIDINTLDIIWINFNKMESGDVLIVHNECAVISRVDGTYGHNAFALVDIKTGNPVKNSIKDKLSMFLYHVAQIDYANGILDSGSNLYFNISTNKFTKYREESWNFDFICPNPHYFDVSDLQISGGIALFKITPRSSLASLNNINCDQISIYGKFSCADRFSKAVYLLGEKISCLITFSSRVNEGNCLLIKNISNGSYFELMENNYDYSTYFIFDNYILAVYFLKSLNHYQIKKHSLK